MSGEPETAVSGWTVDTLRAHFQRQFDDMQRMLDERYATQVKAVDAAFLAQQTAMQTALSAAEKAVECCSMDTPVLCADLVWRPAGDLKVGDELIAFDEHAPPTPRGRRFRRATVTGNTPRRDELVLVRTSRGDVRCNARHPWLARFPKERWRWIRAADLEPGEQVMQVVDVWDGDRSPEDHWLGGMFDGEGCLCFKNSTNGKARLSIVQAEGETATRLEGSLQTLLPSVGIRRRPGVGAWRPKLEFEINARPDVMKMLGHLRPERLLAKADAVWEDFPISNNNRAATIVSVEPAGRGRVASLTTSTGTYIANGFAMHNTALLSAEKAVTKAELAADKRFEAVNEFRAQLADQAATLMARTEADARLLALSEKLETETARVNAQIGEIRGSLADERGIYVTIEKYEDRLKAESTAREQALIRVDEKFADYVKRWEQRQRELDIEIANQKSAAEAKGAVLEAAAMEAQKIAEKQGRDAILAAQELSRKTNRNMGLFAIVVTVVVAIANGAGPF